MYKLQIADWDESRHRVFSVVDSATTDKNENCRCLRRCLRLSHVSRCRWRSFRCLRSTLPPHDRCIKLVELQLLLVSCDAVADVCECTCPADASYEHCGKGLILTLGINNTMGFDCRKAHWVAMTIHRSDDSDSMGPYSHDRGIISINGWTCCSLRVAYERMDLRSSA